MSQRKLDATRVTDILYLYAQYGNRLNFSVLARSLGVSPVTIHAIAHRKIWGYLPVPPKTYSLPAIYETIPNLISPCRQEPADLMSEDRRRELRKKVDHCEWLTDLERAVITAYYGLNRHPPKTLSAIAVQKKIKYPQAHGALRIAFKKIEGKWRPPRHHLPNEEKSELLKKIGRCKALTERERYALIARYGLDEQPPRTLEDIGRTLSVTREWVRKIVAQALAKLDSQ